MAPDRWEHVTIGIAGALVGGERLAFDLWEHGSEVGW